MAGVSILPRSCALISRHRARRRRAVDGDPEIQSAQRALTTHLLPALLFLLMVTCDLHAVLRLGPESWRCLRRAML